MRFEKALVLSDGEARQVQVVLNRQLPTRFDWQVYAAIPGGTEGAPEFVRHAGGQIRVSTSEEHQAEDVRMRSAPRTTIAACRISS